MAEQLAPDVAALSLDEAPAIARLSADALDSIASFNCTVDPTASAFQYEASVRESYYSLPRAEQDKLSKKRNQLLKAARAVAARDALAMMGTCSAWQLLLRTSESVWGALLVARFPELKCGSLKLGAHDTYRCMLNVVSLRSSPICLQPSPNAGTQLEDFTFTFEGTLVPAPITLHSPVVIHGLSASPQYNGQKGRVIEQRGERWGVRLDGGGSLAVRASCLRLQRFDDLGFDFDGEPKEGCEPTPFGARQSWMGIMTAEELEGKADAIDRIGRDVYFGSAYDHDYSDAQTLLSVYVTTPTMQTVKIYETAEIYGTCRPPGGERGMQMLLFDKKTLPYAAGQEAGSCPAGREELLILATLDFSIALVITTDWSGEEMPASVFLKYLQGDDGRWWGDFE